MRDNLLLAKPAATEAEINRALEQACAEEFVAALPKQLDTNIGEKGIRLSQGEKQRLTIARVLLKNPPFVILDEATASVDTITERKIQRALDHLVEERTVLVIAHRLSTVRTRHHGVHSLLSVHPLTRRNYSTACRVARAARFLARG